jgi:hypothetical protein
MPSKVQEGRAQCFFLETHRRNRAALPLPSCSFRSDARMEGVRTAAWSGSGLRRVESDGLEDWSTNMAVQVLVQWLYESGYLRNITPQSGRLRPTRAMACHGPWPMSMSMPCPVPHDLGCNGGRSSRFADRLASGQWRDAKGKCACKCECAATATAAMIIPRGR